MYRPVCDRSSYEKTASITWQSASQSSYRASLSFIKTTLFHNKNPLKYFHIDNGLVYTTARIQARFTLWDRPRRSSTAAKHNSNFRPNRQRIVNNLATKDAELHFIAQLSLRLMQASKTKGKIPRESITNYLNAWQSRLLIWSLHLHYYIRYIGISLFCAKLKHITNENQEKCYCTNF